MVTLIKAHRVRIAKSCLTKIARVKCVFAYRLSPAEINLECVLLWRRRRRQTWSTKRNFGAGTKTVTGLNFETNVDVMDQLIELCVFCNFLCLYFSLFSVCQYFHSVSNIFLCFSFTFFYVHLCMIAPFVNLYFTVLCLLYFSLFFIFYFPWCFLSHSLFIFLWLLLWSIFTLSSSLSFIFVSVFISLSLFIFKWLLLLSVFTLSTSLSFIFVSVFISLSMFIFIWLLLWSIFTLSTSLSLFFFLFLLCFSSYLFPLHFFVCLTTLGSRSITPHHPMKSGTLLWRYLTMICVIGFAIFYLNFSFFDFFLLSVSLSVRLLSTWSSKTDRCLKFSLTKRKKWLKMKVRYAQRPKR